MLNARLPSSPCSAASSLGPVFDGQAWHSAEVPRVVGDNREAQTQRLRGHQGVVHPDRLTASREGCRDHSEPLGTGFIERHYSHIFREAANSASKLLRSLRLSTKAQLSQRDRTDAEVRRRVLQQASRHLPLTPQRIAHGVGIQQVPGHSSRMLCEAGSASPASDAECHLIQTPNRPETLPTIRPLAQG